MRSDFCAAGEDNKISGFHGALKLPLSPLHMWKMGKPRLWESQQQTWVDSWWVITDTCSLVCPSPSQGRSWRWDGGRESGWYINQSCFPFAERWPGPKPGTALQTPRAWVPSWKTRLTQGGWLEFILFSYYDKPKRFIIIITTTSIIIIKYLHDDCWSPCILNKYSLNRELGKETFQL